MEDHLLLPYTSRRYPWKKPNNKKRRIPNNNKQTRNSNTDPTKKICHRNDSNTTRQHNHKTTNHKDEGDGNNNSFIFVSPRTPTKHTKRLPTTRQTKQRKTPRCLPHKHKQPSDTQRSDNSSDEYTTSIQIRNNMDSTDGGNRNTPSLQYTNNRPSTSGTSATSRPNTTHAMVPTTNSTMEGPKDTRHTTPPQSTNNTNTSITDSDTSTSDADEESTITTIYHTFILHKTNQNPPSQTANRGKPAPTFIGFDHGSHYHIIFAADERGGNGARQRGRIAQYLGSTTAGSTEIIATHTKVFFLKRFILYCIRNGIQTAELYGIRINQQMKEAFSIFQTLYHNRDPNTVNTEIKECKKYIEDNKQFTRLGKHKRRNVVDTITEVINHYDIKTTHPHITKSKHTHTHTLQNPHTHPHITKSTHTHTHNLKNPHIHTPTHYKIHTYTHTL